MENVEEKTAENVLRVSSSQQKKNRKNLFSHDLFFLFLFVFFFGQKGKKRRTRICVYKCVCLFQDEQQITCAGRERREEDGYRLLDVYMCVGVCGSQPGVATRARM